MAFTTNDEYISVDSYTNIFKGWVDSIFSKLTTIFENFTVDNIETKNVVKVNNEFYNSFQKDLIKEVIDDTESIAHFLKTEHILTKEYYDFREIQRLLIKTL
ncbi:MAG: hypothetical protein Q4P14_04465, partial [Methanobacteriaceae archaeon]|nr:hypothetical protein [Methanobacteriaceae archaeon]